MGFSLVVKILIEAKKPIVGHNMIYDIFYLYNQFIDDMPPTYQQFIAEVIPPTNLLISGTSCSLACMTTKWWPVPRSTSEGLTLARYMRSVYKTIDLRAQRLFSIAMLDSLATKGQGSWRTITRLHMMLT